MRVMTILDKLKAGLITRSSLETEACGKRLAEALPEDALLTLSGDLGTGKTTLVRGLARGLGITANITSPTYTIYTIYQGRRQLLHMDAYRIEGPDALDALMLEEFLISPFLIALEWPEQVVGAFEDLQRWSLALEIVGEDRHQIRLMPPGRKG